VEREWRRADRVDGERTMGFGASTRKGGCKIKIKMKKMERRTIFEDGVVVLALDLGEREEVGV